MGFPKPLQLQVKALPYRVLMFGKFVGLTPYGVFLGGF
jgi:hypothetical protein